MLPLCARLGLDPAGRVFAVAGGLLVTLDGPTPGVFPGAIRLRGLARNLLLPVDAELAPALLDDEAQGLTRDRGIVFLPDGRALGFDPRDPIEPSTLLAAASLPRRAWGPLPEPERLADRSEEFLVELPGLPTGDSPGGEGPDEVADRVLGPGNEDVGSESPRPGRSGAAASLAGGAAMRAGKALIRLGDALGLKGLAALGARLIRGAIGLAPRLSEAVLDRQAAALRELLREFREGDPERALRRALPLGEPGGPRGARPGTGDRLPTHDLAYRLSSLLAGSGGPADVWLGAQDMAAELAEAYRRAAVLAIARGDHRRAAFIYGKLLHDYRSAAHALSRGGLHRDAAAIFLAKLDDP